MEHIDRPFPALGRWKIPPNLAQKVAYWQSLRGSSRPSEWTWFRDWALNDEDVNTNLNVGLIIKDMGWSGIYTKSVPRPPPAYRERLRAILQPQAATKAAESINELSKLAETQQKQLQECRRRMEAMQTERERLQQQIEELRKRTKCDDIPAPPPPPPMPETMKPNVVKKVVSEAYGMSQDLLTSIHKGTTLKKVEKAPQAAPKNEQGLRKTLEDAMSMRRGAMQNDQDDDQDSDWDNADCAVCGLPANQTCGKCLEVAYCSRECQKEDWDTYHCFQCGPN